MREAPSCQAAALVVGGVFLLVGILGFIPGITSGYVGMEAAGHESHAELLGVFQVVHILFGVAGLVLARTPANARNYLLGGGAVYLVLWVYGVVIDKSSPANFVPVNAADDWLHFFLGVGMIALGVLFGRRATGVTGADRLTERSSRSTPAVVHLGSTRVLFRTVTMDSSKGADFVETGCRRSSGRCPYDGYRALRPRLSEFVARASACGLAGRWRYQGGAGGQSRPWDPPA